MKLSIQSQGAAVGYLFAYFKGDSLVGENVFFALSEGNNALRWKELNDGQPVLSSDVASGGLRDPFLFRSEIDGKHYLLATDLSIGRGTTWQEAVTSGSRDIIIFESEDLVSWSAPRAVRLAPLGAGNAWAPKAIFDETSQEYVVIWSSNTTQPEGLVPTYQKVFSSRTSDFRQFSELEVWIDHGDSVIDVSIIKRDGVWHRFSKSESQDAGCSDVLHEVSTEGGALLGPRTWSIFDSCISTRLGLSPVEGPILFPSNLENHQGANFYLFLDRYTAGGYSALTSIDLQSKDWRVPKGASLPPGARHGSVIALNETQLARIKSRLT